MDLGLVNRIRRNHAIEHATIAVLLERGERPPLAGYGAPGGFFIYGDLATEDVSSAAAEAIGRMQGGERELAVSPFCGTNLAVGALLAALVAGIIVRSWKGRAGQLPLVALGVVGSIWVRRPLGHAVQRHLTTLSDVDDVEIVGTRRFSLGRHTLHRVTTRGKAHRR